MKKKKVELIGSNSKEKRAIRFVYDENGNPVRGAVVPFDEIPEEYEVKTIKLTKIRDLSYLGYVREISDLNIFKSFYKDKEGLIAERVLSELAKDYLQSAICLRKNVVKERNGSNPVISRYQIPCLFCCRHAVELKLKQCVHSISGEKQIGHSINKLWETITNKRSGIGIEQLKPFIQEVDAMDKNGLVMRYGLNKKLELFKEGYLIDVDVLINNTKYLFNVLAVECSCF